MRRRSTAALTALATALSLVVIVLGSASPSTSAAQQSASLRVTPEAYVGGQALTFAGRIPGAANKNLKLQRLFNRPGDSWVTLPGVVGRSNSQGDFQFVHIGPNNFNIRYRVKAVGGGAGPAVLLQPRQQELVLRLDGGPVQMPGRVVSGRSFTIDVNTTPTGRGDIGRPPPAFPGRTLTLQQRVGGNRWSTVATGAASQSGSARFVLTAGQPGRTAYRVRQEAIKTGGNKIGWFPSFPLQVRVVKPGSGRAVPARSVEQSPEPAGSERPLPSLETLARSGGTPTASARYKWGPSQYDFAWEFGESLTDQPYRGRRLKGRWIDRSNGSGRVAHHNGGMAMSSNVSELPGKGDNGATSATLTGHALTYGRWEFRRRIDVYEKAGRDYRVKIELVPARAKDARCGANTISVSNVAFDSRRATLGVTSSNGKRAWKGSRRIPRMGAGPHTWGVEVTRRHITWFLDGRSVATVNNRKAVPGVPLTPKLSMVGVKQKEMRRTRVLYDWQRGWKLNKQAKRTQKGPGLKVKNLRNSC